MVMITDQETQTYNDLAEFLFAKGELSEQDFDTVIELQQNSGQSLQSILVGLNIVSKRVVAKALSEYYKTPFVDSTKYPDEILFTDEYCSPEFFQQQRVVPIYVEENQIVLAMADPSDKETIEAVQEASGKRVLPRVGFIRDIKRAQNLLYNTRVDQHSLERGYLESKLIPFSDDNILGREKFKPKQVIRIPGGNNIVESSEVSSKKSITSKIVLLFIFLAISVLAIKAVFYSY